MDKLTMKVLGLPKGQAWSECNRILLQSRLSPRRYSDMQTEIEIVEPQSTQRHIEESPVAHLGRQTDRHDSSGDRRISTFRPSTRSPLGTPTPVKLRSTRARKASKEGRSVMKSWRIDCGSGQSGSGQSGCVLLKDSGTSGSG